MSNMISLVIPVYNLETKISRCIDSILRQSYKDFELILVDDGSNDNSGIVCDQYALKDKRIRVLHKANNGVSSARNTGIEAANGDYLGFVDGDDYVREDYLEQLLLGDEDLSIASMYYATPDGAGISIARQEADEICMVTRDKLGEWFDRGSL